MHLLFQISWNRKKLQSLLNDDYKNLLKCAHVFFSLIRNPIGREDKGRKASMLIAIIIIVLNSFNLTSPVKFSPSRTQKISFSKNILRGVIGRVVGAREGGRGEYLWSHVKSSQSTISRGMFPRSTSDDSLVLCPSIPISTTPPTVSGTVRPSSFFHRGYSPF